MSSLARVHRGFAARYALVCALFAALIAGCGSTTASTGVSAGAATDTSSAASVLVVRDDANGKTLDVPAGSTVQLILASSYWHVAGSSAPAVLRQDGATRVLPRPSTCPNIPGLGCAPVQTQFTALTPGTASITADRTTCGEARNCPPGQQHFAVTVVVQ
ncbi:hypothetical protein KGA66_19260 [Actinocrinis puniceicyclus]|uniref:Proteinase inhibitor I42 chagasin domain-containing protein n=1 Tax=Actinocrinis puniceicyclus TaxID=977794 RepID=A0A8J8BCK3_9ACTN|nr:hypothetical protein [Actinocrinis puniceicyclus]MBS2965197.1 hypothetical protein [Actinocrinis puniceicyclus]